MAIKLNPQCGDPLDKCFARVMGSCTVLTSTCDRKPCPFKKDRKTYTNGSALSVQSSLFRRARGYEQERE